MSEFRLTLFGADEGCAECGVEPCACPAAAAAIDALAPPLLEIVPATKEDPRTGEPLALQAWTRQAAEAFLDRRYQLEEAHGEAAACHRSREPLCALIDAEGRINTVKSLVRGRGVDDLRRARLHVETVGAILATLWETLSEAITRLPDQETIS